MGNIQTYQLQMIDFRAGGNYQMQIVTTKLSKPTNYKGLIPGGGGKQPIVIPSTTYNCSHASLKMKSQFVFGSLPPPQESIICSW